jgi:hypothetical protein
VIGPIARRELFIFQTGQDAFKNANHWTPGQINMTYLIGFSDHETV